MLILLALWKLGFKKSIKELGIENTVVIADKGFGSSTNFELMQNSNLNYIIPLRRNNGFCIRDKLKTGNKSELDGYFLYNGRAIWYYEYTVDEKRFIMYIDETLKAKEERDYLGKQ